jgi:ATP-dependent Clp protease protease subunit
MENRQVTMMIEGQQTLVSIDEYEFHCLRTIRLTGEINDVSAKAVIQALLYLDGKSHDDITLVIFSPGGWVSAGWAIYDVLHSIKSKVNTVGSGMAASMGAFLLAAGTGTRSAYENCDILLHQPMGGVSGQASDISIVAAHIQKEKIKLAAALANICAKPVSTLLKVMDRDSHYSAKEAVKFGLITHIYEINKEKQNDVQCG